MPSDAPQNPNPGNLGKPSAWTFFADKDLSAAECLAKAPDLAEGVIFHAQQAVEKYLKAFLAAHGILIQKIHDLPKLYGEVKKIKDFGFDEMVLAELTNLYIENRYPFGTVLLIGGNEPSSEDAAAYLAFARMVAQAIQAEIGGAP
jgi:HEPN domain-containing protein